MTHLCRPCREGNHPICTGIRCHCTATKRCRENATLVSERVVVGVVGALLGLLVVVAMGLDNPKVLVPLSVTTSVEQKVSAAQVPELAAPSPTTSAVVTPERNPVGQVTAASSGPSTPVVDLIRLRFIERGVADAETAVRVARCESSFDPSRTGKAGERGVMQVHPIHRGLIESMGFTWDDMYEVGPNLDVAFALSRNGWGPWKGCL